jgi:murein DD-endopeptidase MepM/ murein hydrolase activator NlpD
MPRGVPNDQSQGYGIAPTGLTPSYPEGYECSPLTSLYGSWIDVDGSTRDEIHSGVDGGRLGDAILSPAAGVVKASWEADWGWGKEGALLIRHARRDLNLRSGSAFYYSAFYHLRVDDAQALTKGAAIERGQLLGIVSRPGGRRRYLPEVHWEVYEVADDRALEWGTNERKHAYWTNATARLVDPLQLLGLEHPPGEDKRVRLQPFVEGRNYRGFRGFTYILPCRPT